MDKTSKKGGRPTTKPDNFPLEVKLGSATAL